ncbi:MAG: hypothetical protein WKF71_05590 [Pyrinomonadaceae bacterium]
MAFFVPGCLLIFLGIIGYALALPGLTVAGRVHFDVHTLLFSSFFITSGYQAILFAILTKTFAVNEKMVPEDRRLARFYKTVNLENGLLISLFTLLAGLILLGFAVNEWRNANFGNLEYSRMLRVVIPGVMLASIGFESVLFSFFASILGVRRRRH